MTQFAIGDRVRKPEGHTGYQFHATVQSVFETREGVTRVVCESTVIPKLLHILSPQQIEHAPIGDASD